MKNYNKELEEKYSKELNQLKWLYENDGKNKPFVLNDTNLEIILKLLTYFKKDQEACNHFEISLNKGIMLFGMVGVGKTSLMLHLNKIFNNFQRSKNCKKIETQFLIDKDKSIIKKNSDTFKNNGSELIPIIAFFDDLGIEKPINDFGTEIDLMSEILFQRHDQQMKHPELLTHITTNLNPNQIEERYGSRLRSRFGEMFNQFIFNENSLDKRRL